MSTECYLFDNLAHQYDIVIPKDYKNTIIVIQTDNGKVTFLEK